MKTIKIKFVGFWPEFVPEKFWLYEMLTQHYEVVICDDPDYLICSVFDHHPYIEYPQIRIQLSGENFIPDFNLVDYAISVYPLEFLDRHFSTPAMVDRLDGYQEALKKNRDYSPNILQSKVYFANLIASHESDNGIRKRIFDSLSQYKRIEAPGQLFYNMPNGETVNRSDGSKQTLLQKCKFTICCESTNEHGFITEKILEAFCADTIPVYWGSRTVTDVFNKDAFINVTDFDDFQKVIDQIIALDKDDTAYLEMLRQPIFARPDFVKTKLLALERFVCNIFDQPIEVAYRRPMSYSPKAYENTVRLGRNARINGQKGISRVPSRFRQMLSYTSSKLRFIRKKR